MWSGQRVPANYCEKDDADGDGIPECLKKVDIIYEQPLSPELLIANLLYPYPFVFNLHAIYMHLQN